MSTAYLCIHGHFYQPPRDDPRTGRVPREPGAAPYHDFNEKIWAECYRTNAELGNFARMSFNLGPTLASWMQHAHPDTMATILSGVAARHRATGCSNALAQTYHHTILPLATPCEKRLQIAWGRRDFERRYGFSPRGVWLPEAAVDAATLEELSAQGFTYTILAPWQAASPIRTDTPYLVTAARDRRMTLFFYHAGLSGQVSFDDEATADAARFVARYLLPAYGAPADTANEAPLVLIATDGEAYGHHKPFRDLFLHRVLAEDAPAAGIDVVSLDAYLAAHPARRNAEIHPVTSWSCAHGVARWDQGCSCTEGDSSWKRPLRLALRNLATRLDAIYLAETEGLLADPWDALEDYLDLHDGVVDRPTFFARHARTTLRSADERQLHALLDMQFARHAMFVSCAWFFEDLDRIEPRIALAHAAHAIELARRHASAELAPTFCADLTVSVSRRTGRSAADLYVALRKTSAS